MMKFCIFLLQLALLVIVSEIGQWLAAFLRLPIPGNVTGMILLFLLLMTGIIKLEWIEISSNFLIRHLSFFFIPFAVGLMNLGGLLSSFAAPMLLILTVSPLLALAASAAIVQKLGQKRREYSK